MTGTNVEPTMNAMVYTPSQNPEATMRTHDVGKLKNEREISSSTQPITDGDDDDDSDDDNFKSAKETRQELEGPNFELLVKQYSPDLAPSEEEEEEEEVQGLETATTLSATERDNDDVSVSSPTNQDALDGQEQEQEQEKVAREEQEDEEDQGLQSSVVSFGAVEIREYPITIGDNPGARRGPPVTIEWEHQSTASMRLDEYEAHRPPRRRGPEIIMTSSVREDMLRSAGFSRGEIQGAVKRANIARNSRKRTEELMQLSSLQEAAEKLKRGALNKVFMRGRKKKERKYIEEAFHVHKLKAQAMENNNNNED